ncbi:MULTISPECIES: transposase [unclassified Nocardia]|uniref:transposase n=1 Tax=Nocardia sp. NPDC056541 TaxID=3345860 RepID=UPI00366AD636
MERTFSWLTGYHRRTLHYDRKAEHFFGFLTLAAALTCFKKLAKPDQRHETRSKAPGEDHQAPSQRAE